MGEISLGRKLLLFRTYHGINQQEFAKILGISNAALSRMENDLYEHQSRFDSICRLCDEFNISLSVFQNTSKFFEYLSSLEQSKEIPSSKRAEAIIGG